MDDFSNRVIKGYEFKERVGAGGFGAVYRAYQPAVGREVAIKVILPQHANQPDFIRRFEIEAQLIARLEHPHIVPLYDYWREPEGAFLVMRWLRSSLRGSVGRGAWNVEAAARLLEQIAGALMVAHREDVIHRDIKPDNILLDEDDNAYLADFGIAKNLSVGVVEGNITQAGEVVGSPAYITPEQINGDAVTARTDIYSLGLVIYEMLVGEKPYADAQTPYELIGRQLNTPLPPLHTCQPNLPAALNEVLQTATAKDPALRYANALRFAAAFRAALPNLQRAPAQPLAEPLTGRELDIIRLMIEGLSNIDIAERLVLSAVTVKWYIRQIYSKLDVHSRQQAVQRAKQLNLNAHTPIPGVLNGDVPTLQTMARKQPIALGPGPVNPYKGLRAFQEADAADFFGRAALTERLLARLAESGEGARFVVVIGPSGSGKSSVVRAGLIPALRRGGLPNSERWFITDMLPGTHPLEELEAALLRVATSQQSGLLDQLSEDRRGLVRAAKRLLPTEQETELVLVIDQFEELFTLLDDEAVRTHFIDNLLSAVTDPRSRVRIVLTLRADFYDKPLLYPRLAELVRSHTEVLLPLGSDELERAIAGPAERVGLSLEPGLAATIIKDVGEQPGTLPLLQYALVELYERRNDRSLTLDAYRASGGLSGALALRADAVFNNLDTVGQVAARQLFLRLITPGEGTEDTRRRVLLTELASITDSDQAIDEVIAVFSQYRLLTFDHDPVTRGATVELAHEVLIREWGRLREWLREGREDLRMQRRLMGASAEWVSAGHDTSFLATGIRLDQFSAWVSDTSLALTQDERTYLEISVAEADVRRVTDLARKERERTFQRRSAHRLRYLVVVLTLFLLVATGLAAFAFQSRGEALHNGQIADDNAATAVANLDHADSLRLAAQAINILQANGDPQLGALLSLRSLKNKYSPEGDAALQQAAGYDYPLRTFQTDGAINSISFSPDGTSILTGTSVLQSWNTQTGTQLHELSQPSIVKSVMVRDVNAVFSADGKYILTYSIGDLSAYTWDATTSKEIHIFMPYGPTPCGCDNLTVTSVAVSPDARYMLTGTVTGEVLLWDVKTPDSSVQNFFGPTNAVVSVAFSPDDKYILASSADNTVRLWDAGTGAEVRQFKGQTGYVRSVAFSPDGKYVLTGGTIDDTARLWDAGTGAEVRRFIGHTAGIEAVAFSPDGHSIFTGVDDRTARMWDIQTGLELRRFTGYSASVSSLGVSSDGKYLVTASDNRVSLWQISRPASALTFIGHSGNIFAAAFSPDGTQLITGGEDHTIRLWDVAKRQQVKQYTTNFPVVSLALSPDGNSLFYSGYDASVCACSGQSISYLATTQTGAELHQFILHGNIYAAAFSPDGKYVLTGTQSFGLGIYTALLSNVTSGVMPCALTHYELAGARAYAIVGSVAFSADGKYALTRGGDGTASLWNIQTCSKIRDFSDPTQPTLTIVSPESSALSPDGNSVLTGNPDGTVRLWDAHTGTQLRQFTGHTGAVRSAAFSPDGSTIVTGSADQTARLWDTQTGQQLRIFTNTGGVNVVAFSPDGRFVLVATDNGMARLWDLSQIRMDWYNNRLRTVANLDPRPTYCAADFDRMITETKPDTVIVSTIDATHHEYIAHAMERGCDVISEKPMTTLMKKG